METEAECSFTQPKAASSCFACLGSEGRVGLGIAEHSIVKPYSFQQYSMPFLGSPEKCCHHIANVEQPPHFPSFSLPTSCQASHGNPNMAH